MLLTQQDQQAVINVSVIIPVYIVADGSAKGGQQPTIINSTNGTPQINIQTPSAAGVSRNVYSQFDVDKKGVVLNNSHANAQTQIAGMVNGKPWLAKGKAKVILNEVNARDPSQLNGFIEVAGRKAQVVIANPSGITCNGCGFINANRATLSTGQAQMSNGQLTGYNVDRGEIVIQGNGLDSSQQDSTNLISRAVKVNAGNCPVIVEYKRHSNENVINQGLFYLNWLQDHQAEFRWLVMDKLGKETAECIDWLGTRLLCIVADFNKYDQHAVQQIIRNISLIRYKLFSEDLLMFELVNAITEKLLQPTMFADVQPNKQAKFIETAATERHDLHQNRIAMASPELLTLYQEVCDYSESLGDDVQRKELKFYTAFQKIKNFVSLQIWAPQRAPQLRLYLKLNPREVELSKGFIHDVTDKGHWGTGNLEIIIRTKDDLDKAKLLIERSYQEN